jgi:hypothetical protein
MAIDVLLGGGAESYDISERLDGRDMFAELKKKVHC